MGPGDKSSPLPGQLHLPRLGALQRECPGRYAGSSKHFTPCPAARAQGGWLTPTSVEFTVGVGSGCRKPEKAQRASVCGTMVPPGGCPSNRSRAALGWWVASPSLKYLWQIAPRGYVLTCLTSSRTHRDLELQTVCAFPWMSSLPAQPDGCSTLKMRFLFCTGHTPGFPSRTGTLLDSVGPV